MKQFCCGDVVPGCSASFEAADEAALFGQIAVHARAAHGLSEISPVRSKIRDTNAAA